MKSILLLFLLVGMVTGVQGADYDLIIRKGRIVDGSGENSFLGDIGIREGKIVAVGEVTGNATRELDAGGLVVAPGFIDVHSHAENVERHPLAENFLRMGVTTLVLGNCGWSRVDLPTYFAKLAGEGTSANVATLIGHGAVRAQVIGESIDRPPSPEELEEMKTLVERAMEEGAVGLSTGLIYLPGTFAKTDEIVELAKVAQQHDGIYVSHMRNEGRGMIGALEELLTIAREAEIRAQVSHIKLSGRYAWGKAEEVLAVIESARAEGLSITQDQYMYTASSTGVSQLIPGSAREGGREKFRERMADPEQKERIMASMEKGMKANGWEDYSYVAIAYYRPDPSLNGLRVPAAAKKKLGSDDLKSQIELILEIEAHGGASGVYHTMNEEDLQTFLRSPNTMIAADSGVRSFGSGVPHPRGYGNNARALARYTRDLEVLRLEETVRRMTSLPAATFQMEKRGKIAEGNWADLVVFDAETVQDRGEFDEPHQYATGFRYVLVNGEVTVENDVHTQAKAGQIVRRGK